MGGHEPVFMIAFVKKIDISLFYLINRDWQNEFFDVFMPFMSNIKNFYIPIALLWVFLILKKNAK